MQEQRTLTPYEVNRLMEGEDFDLLPARAGYRIALLLLDGKYVARYAAVTTRQWPIRGCVVRDSNCARSQRPF